MADQAEYFIETQLPDHQKHYNSFSFPSVLSPNPTSSPSSLSVFTRAIRSQKPFLDSLLLKAGAVLFRGFPVETAKDFNDVVEAFGFEELPYVGGAAPRTNVVGRVFTANESPPDQKIPFHHEMAQVNSFFLNCSQLKWVPTEFVLLTLEQCYCLIFDHRFLNFHPNCSSFVK